MDNSLINFFIRLIITVSQSRRWWKSRFCCFGRRDRSKLHSKRRRRLSSYVFARYKFCIHFAHRCISQLVVEYAKWLGMDLEKDQDLYWIAREGLMVIWLDTLLIAWMILKVLFIWISGAASKRMEAVQNQRHWGFDVRFVYITIIMLLMSTQIFTDIYYFNFTSGESTWDQWVFQFNHILLS